MSGFDERKKALEEEYFKRKEQEAIEKLREQRVAEERVTAELALTIACPKCDGRLKVMSYDDIQIDRCTKCNGIWLDAGELDRLMEKEDEGSFFSRMWRSFSG